MHSNWSHCLQEVFNSGKLAIPVFKLKNHTIRIQKMLFLFGKLPEKSYHQDFKTFKPEACNLGITVCKNNIL